MGAFGYKLLITTRKLEEAGQFANSFNQKDRVPGLRIFPDMFSINILYNSETIHMWLLLSHLQRFTPSFMLDKPFFCSRFVPVLTKKIRGYAADTNG